MEDKYTKVGFDGRLKYYEHLKSYWERMADATFNDDYDLKYKALRGYFARTSGFIKDKQIIKDMFVKVKKTIDGISAFGKQHQYLVINRIENLLQEIEDLLFIATKDMLVSTKDEDEDEFDMEAFLKDSE